jgi:hypothetical protein
VPEACNIGPRQRRLRLLVAAGALLVLVSMVLMLWRLDLGRPWRAILFAPLWLGALGYFEARDATCVALAARGRRNLDAGEEPVGDPSEAARLSRQAKAIYLKATAVALLGTAVALLVPRG